MDVSKLVWFMRWSPPDDKLFVFKPDELTYLPCTLRLRGCSRATPAATLQFNRQVMIKKTVLASRSQRDALERPTHHLVCYACQLTTSRAMPRGQN